MAMSKKEMGLAVRALGQYADDCLSDRGDYIEMVSASNVAKNLYTWNREGRKVDIKNYSHILQMKT